MSSHQIKLLLFSCTSSCLIFHPLAKAFVFIQLTSQQFRPSTCILKKQHLYRVTCLYICTLVYVLMYLIIFFINFIVATTSISLSQRKHIGKYVILLFFLFGIKLSVFCCCFAKTISLLKLVCLLLQRESVSLSLTG